MRVAGYISPSKVAALLDVNIKTVYVWCQKAVSGEPSKLRDVKQHINGYFWINKEEVMLLRRLCIKK